MNDMVSPATAIHRKSDCHPDEKSKKAHANSHQIELICFSTNGWNSNGDTNTTPEVNKKRIGGNCRRLVSYADAQDLAVKLKDYSYYSWSQDEMQDTSDNGSLSLSNDADTDSVETSNAPQLSSILKWKLRGESKKRRKHCATLDPIPLPASIRSPKVYIAEEESEEEKEIDDEKDLTTAELIHSTLSIPTTIRESNRVQITRPGLESLNNSPLVRNLRPISSTLTTPEQTICPHSFKSATNGQTHSKPTKHSKHQKQHRHLISSDTVTTSGTSETYHSLEDSITPKTGKSICDGGDDHDGCGIRQDIDKYHNNRAYQKHRVSKSPSHRFRLGSFWRG